MFTLCREISQNPTSNSTTQYGSFFYNKCTLYYSIEYRLYSDVFLSLLFPHSSKSHTNPSPILSPLFLLAILQHLFSFLFSEPCSPPSFFSSCFLSTVISYCFLTFPIYFIIFFLFSIISSLLEYFFQT